MSDVDELSAADLSFLGPYLPHDEVRPTDLPFVTLTYACSLDGMISLGPGLRTTLSGSQTKSMTHYLRLKHDAILVGVGTAIADDPGLNCRYPGATLEAQPQPIIVDPRRRWNYDGSKLEILANSSAGKAPWLAHAASESESDQLVSHSSGPRHLFFPSTKMHGPAGGKQMIDWFVMLQELKRKGVNSVMIEGGANIISALLQTPNLVHAVIVTIAPTWLGQGGVLASPAALQINGQRVNAANLQDTAWRQFGNDVVLCGRPR